MLPRQWTFRLARRAALAAAALAAPAVTLVELGRRRAAPAYQLRLQDRRRLAPAGKLLRPAGAQAPLLPPAQMREARRPRIQRPKCRRGLTIKREASGARQAHKTDKTPQARNDNATIALD